MGSSSSSSSGGSSSSGSRSVREIVRLRQVPVVVVLGGKKGTVLQLENTLNSKTCSPDV